MGFIRLFFCWWLCLSWGWSSTSLWGQASTPKREFRGAWIATVNNIDWPSRAGLSASEQQQELRTLLDTLRSHGLNAVILQVRAASDALYPSAEVPWSKSLSGVQGQPPRPMYDPLAFAIEEAHQRGMEFHAWFNPFRADQTWDSTKVLAANHVYYRHPEWCLAYGKGLYLNPAIPEVRRYVVERVMEVLRGYPIDAVHFDDYFYPYQVAGQAFPDSISFLQYGSPMANLGDWRRDNITQFIEELRDSMLRVAPAVQFGISPFAVWRNDRDDPRGSPTRAGQTSYDALYADVRYWLEAGLIDYVAPQLYFSIGYEAAAFDRLLTWWRDNCFGRRLYLGHGLYKINDNPDPHWQDPGQIPAQVRLLRNYPEVKGSVWYSASWFARNPLGFADSLRQHYYRYPAFIPPLDYLDDQPPLPPAATDSDSEKPGIGLNWLLPNHRDVTYVAIYRQRGKVPPPLEPAYLVAVVPASETQYLDTDTRFLKQYSYRLSTIDAAYNESLTGSPLSQRRWSGLFGR
jgi:uncharacterized lipoprotein YddW (UPF0748 family)